MRNLGSGIGKVVEGLEKVMEIGASADNAGKFHMKKVSIVVE